MGAFDGIRIPYDKGYPTSDYHNPYEYFPTQTAFRFFKGFGMPELKKLLAESDNSNSKVVYVPQERRGSGSIGLDSWYVRALIQEHEQTKLECVDL